MDKYISSSLFYIVAQTNKSSSYYNHYLAKQYKDHKVLNQVMYHAVRCNETQPSDIDFNISNLSEFDFEWFFRSAYLPDVHWGTILALFLYCNNICQKYWTEDHEQIDQFIATYIEHVNKNYQDFFATKNVFSLIKFLVDREYVSMDISYRYLLTQLFLWCVSLIY
jgi:hypothetical protein